MKKMYTTLALTALLAGGLTAQENANAATASSEPVKNPAFQTFESNQNVLSPERTVPIPNHEALAADPNSVIDLSSHFTDPGDPLTQLSFDILHNTFPEVATVTINEQQLQVDYLAAGQTNIVIEAAVNGLATTDTFAIGVRPDIETLFGENIEKASFDDLTLGTESYWNGSDESGSFTSGPATFSNSYNPDWFSWSGWAYSSMTDNTTRGYTNQYSAISRARLDSTNGKNYAVAYASPWSDVLLDQHSNQEVKGFFVTNSTWTALSMKHGDAFSKKFGGPEGTDPDWLKLTITGTDTDWNSSKVEYYLADYTYANPAKDHVIETWQWVDLSPLGKVSRLQFTMSSTDNGDWGMNTPAYFCMDNLVVVPDADPVVYQVVDISEEPGKIIALALSDIFTDPDDPDDSIQVDLVPGSWNTMVVDPVIEEDSLRIDLLDNGESDLALAAFSNGKMVTEMFHISVMITGTDRPGEFNYSGAAGALTNLTAWPNPTSGQIILETTYSQPGQLSIVDPSGRTVRSIAGHHPGTPVDLSTVPAGIYLLKFGTDNQYNVIRIIKE